MIRLMLFSLKLSSSDKLSVSQNLVAQLPNVRPHVWALCLTLEWNNVTSYLPGSSYRQCWAVTSYCNLVTVIILLFAVASSVTNY